MCDSRPHQCLKTTQWSCTASTIRRAADSGPQAAHASHLSACFPPTTASEQNPQACGPSFQPPARNHGESRASPVYILRTFSLLGTQTHPLHPHVGTLARGSSGTGNKAPLPSSSTDSTASPHVEPWIGPRTPRNADPSSVSPQCTYFVHIYTPRNHVRSLH